MNAIEILKMPNGKFMWIVLIGEAFTHAGEVEHPSALDAELEARTYVTLHHAGEVFVTVHRRQVWPT